MEKNKKLNILPSNPEAPNVDAVVGLGRFPSWLHRKLPQGFTLNETSDIIHEKRLHTVCEEARCPNRLECWSKKTATFLVMGKECTRSCGFCSIDFSKTPKPLNLNEPYDIAHSVKELKLKHVVITMVARDDLSDGGAEHLANIVREIRKENPLTTVELLTSDFNGNSKAWDTVLRICPEILNYNIETVRELTLKVRHTATYERTLEFLHYAKENRRDSKMMIKSGLMLGLGEIKQQVYNTLDDLKKNGCDIVTIGQYLQPNRQKLLVKSFITPDQFNKYEEYGKKIGISYMYCGPFVRSSYNADLIFELLNLKREQDDRHTFS